MTAPKHHTSWIACQGEKGACGHNVTRRASFVQDHFQPAPQPTYEEVFELLNDGRANRAVVAVHNSRTGNVIEPLSLLAQYGFGVVDELYHQINHSLMVTRALATRFGVHQQSDVTDAKRAAILSAVEEVRSDEQGLRQCRDYIARNLPRARPITMLCTATAAKSIKTEADELAQEIENPPFGEAVAAIAGAFCANMYDLIIIERNVQDYEGDNITRYLVMEKSPRDEKAVTQDHDRQLFATTFGEGEEGEQRPADDDQLRQLRELSELADRPEVKAIEGRERILDEDGGYKLAAKVFLLTKNGVPPEFRKHTGFADLAKVLKLLKQPGFEENHNPVARVFKPRLKAAGPFDDMDRNQRREEFLAARRELKLRAGDKHNTSVKSRKQPLSAYRTFVFVRSSNKDKSIHQVLQPLTSNSRFPIEMIQILPASQVGKGEGAIIEVRGAAFPPKKDAKGKANQSHGLGGGGLNSVLAQVEKRAKFEGLKGEGKASSGEMKILGCFLARPVDDSIGEGRLADREYDFPSEANLHA